MEVSATAAVVMGMMEAKVMGDYERVGDRTMVATGMINMSGMGTGWTDITVTVQISWTFVASKTLDMCAGLTDSSEVYARQKGR